MSPRDNSTIINNQMEIKHCACTTIRVNPAFEDGRLIFLDPPIHQHVHQPIDNHELDLEENELDNVINNNDQLQLNYELPNDRDPAVPIIPEANIGITGAADDTPDNDITMGFASQNISEQSLNPIEQVALQTAMEVDEEDENGNTDRLNNSAETVHLMEMDDQIFVYLSLDSDSGDDDF